MIPLFSNATVLWTEREIEKRESLICECYQILKESWILINPVIRFERVETPVLTPESYLKGHLDVGFPLLETERGFLRPETTAGSLAAFNVLFPHKGQHKKILPICIWQAGKSFRNEINSNTMRASKLRLLEFWQIEFQLLTSDNTKADYLEPAINGLIQAFGGEKVMIKDLPHYSEQTIDWEINGIEVASLSKRNDWAGGILFEVAIGLDRLVNIL